MEMVSLSDMEKLASGVLARPIFNQKVTASGRHRDSVITLNCTSKMSRCMNGGRIKENIWPEHLINI